jgi:hypothetical protein
MTWAFEADTCETYEIVCHVLPKFIFSLILGRVFLGLTETLSKHRRRFSACVPILVRQPYFRVGLCGDTCQRLMGVIGENIVVYAVPDTGAEANIIDEW